MLRFICLRYICCTLIFELELVCFLGAKITLISLILFMHSVFHWPLHCLDIKYAFFHEILRMKYSWSNYRVLLLSGNLWFCIQVLSITIWTEPVYSSMVLYVQHNYAKVTQLISLFFCSIGTLLGIRVFALVIYIDDIVMACNSINQEVNVKLKHLYQHFQSKNLDRYQIVIVLRR